ncbi:MAG TPA: bifunctional tetrahydrofolate synthase/dihydrofolate synthase [Gallionellaceae bacterium]|nr:bifunctional tetrahydrofolate synthase/dihydrofolate synthase [Gallionellaceae bacterium]
MPSTLAEWLSHLESLHPKTIALGLERVAEVKQRLQLDPRCPVIIVGGTNGKGSVCAMLESILHAAGYRTGLYTSPHLLDYNERVRIAKQPVSDAELCASFEQIELARRGLPPPCRGKESLPSSHAIPLTYFEFGTLAAMQSFIAHKVDVAILEVGLGGRLDAVNVFDCDCAVVTSIDLDHIDYLGDTREKIAFEKAGIFRAGKVAVFGDPDMPQSIQEQAQQVGAPLWRLGHQFGARAHEQQWDYHGPGGIRSSLPYPALRGAFQLNNASTVLAVLDALKESLPVSMAAVRRGLLEVQLAARFQVLPGRPLLILDVAHNPHAAQSLARNLAGMPPAPRTIAVCAMLKDKDMAGVVRALAPHIDEWLLAGIAAPRGASADELRQVLVQEQVSAPVHVFASANDAVHHACNAAGENDRIVAFGSFYTVAEVMRARGIRIAN